MKIDSVELTAEQRKRKNLNYKDWDERTASVKDWIRESRRAIDEGDIQAAILALCDGLRNTVIIINEQQQAIDVLWDRFMTMPQEQLKKETKK